MTSATAGITKKRSAAAKNLQFALGKTRVLLDNLKPAELNGLVMEQLGSVDMSSLRGFMELREFLCQGSDPRIALSKDAFFQCGDFDEAHPFTFKSHVIGVFRGALLYESVYRRLESVEESTDRSTLLEWGPNGYLHRVTTKILLMRRSDSVTDINTLAEVAYTYVKVPNEKRYVITQVFANPVSISDFSEHYGKDAANVARDILWQISTIYSLTLQAMESKISQFRNESLTRQRLAGSIGCSLH